MNSLVWIRNEFESHITTETSFKSLLANIPVLRLLNVSFYCISHERPPFLSSNQGGKNVVHQSAFFGFKAAVELDYSLLIAGN
jgi:hypothetical protein